MQLGRHLLSFETPVFLKHVKNVSVKRYNILHAMNMNI